MDTLISSASQQILRTLWNLKFNYTIHNSPTCPYPEPHQVRSHISNCFFLRSIVRSPQISVLFTNILCPSHFPAKILYVPLHYSKIITCPVHHNFINLITQKHVSIKQCRSWSSSLFNLFQPSLLLCRGTKIFLLTVFSNTGSLYASINVKEEL